MMSVLVFLVLLTVGVFSGAKTWTRRFDLAVDMLTLSLFTKVYGVTISSACGLALRADPKGTTFLHKLGRVLNKIQTNHCELAIADDTIRLGEGLTYLGALAPTKI